MSNNADKALLSQPSLIVDSTSGTPVSVNSDGSITSRLKDGFGTELTSTLNSGKQSLDVNITGGSSSGPTDTDDDSISVGQIASLSIDLLYGYNGTTWERIKSSSNRLIIDGSQVTQPISGTITANIGTSGSLALDTTVAKLNIVQGSATSGETGPLIQGAVTTLSPSYVTGQIYPLSLDTFGSLRVDNTSWLGSTTPTVGQKTAANSLPVVLASDQTSISVSSSPSTELNSGKVFYAAIDNYNLATAGSNNPIFLFKNPVGSGKIMYVFSVNGNCKITNVQVTFLMFKNPTITTNGTGFTPVNAYFGNGNASVLNVFSGPTVSASGTLVIIDQVGQNANSSNMVIVERIAVPPGQNLLISGNPFSNNRAVIVTVGWVEI